MQTVRMPKQTARTTMEGTRKYGQPCKNGEIKLKRV